MSGTEGEEFVQVPRGQLARERAMLALFDQVWNDGTVGESVRRKAKEINPNLVIPDDNPIVVAERAKRTEVETKVTGLETMLTEFISKAETEKAEGKLRAQLGSVQEKRGLTDTGMAEVIKLMQERSIADPDAAALAYLDSQPKAKPQGGRNLVFDSKADMYGTTRMDEQWETLHTDPDKFFSDVVQEVFNEMPAA